MINLFKIIEDAFVKEEGFITNVSAVLIHHFLWIAQHLLKSDKKCQKIIRSLSYLYENEEKVTQQAELVHFG